MNMQSAITIMPAGRTTSHIGRRSCPCCVPGCSDIAVLLVDGGLKGDDPQRPGDHGNKSPYRAKIFDGGFALPGSGGFAQHDKSVALCPVYVASDTEYLAHTRRNIKTDRGIYTTLQYVGACTPEYALAFFLKELLRTGIHEFSKNGGKVCPQKPNGPP